MRLHVTLLIAVALSMDALAISIADGIAMRRLHLKRAFTLAAWFGGFQALMPFLGWLGGLKLQHLIGAFDHWVAFLLLSFIGAKMIWESFQIESAEKKADLGDPSILFLLSLATSMDAFAAGISFAVLKAAILAPVVIIGLVTFTLSFLGVLIGEKIGHFFEKKIEFLGGLILIGIGLKILLSHLAA